MAEACFAAAADASCAARQRKMLYALQRRIRHRIANGTLVDVGQDAVSAAMDDSSGEASTEEDVALAPWLVRASSGQALDAQAASPGGHVVPRERTKRKKARKLKKKIKKEKRAKERQEEAERSGELQESTAPQESNLTRDESVVGAAGAADVAFSVSATKTTAAGRKRKRAAPVVRKSQTSVAVAEVGGAGAGDEDIGLDDAEAVVTEPDDGGEADFFAKGSVPWRELRRLAAEAAAAGEKSTRVDQGSDEADAAAAAEPALKPQSILKTVVSAPPLCARSGTAVACGPHVPTMNKYWPSDELLDV